MTNLIHRFYSTKLVRDNAPSWILSQNPDHKVSYFILEDEAYSELLKKKLLEEVNEVVDEIGKDKKHLIEEVADVLEVIECIMTFKHIKQANVLASKEKVFKERGGFFDGIFVYSHECKPCYLQSYFLKNQDRYIIASQDQESGLIKFLYGREGKLTRDAVEANVQQVCPGTKIEAKKLSSEELLYHLGLKIKEEAWEVVSAWNDEKELTIEIGDVLEVIDGLCSALDVSIAEVMEKKAKKVAWLGSFKNKIFLEWLQVVPGTNPYESHINKPNRYPCVLVLNNKENILKILL